MSAVLHTLLIATVSPAALVDFKYRKIPNWLTFTAIGVGFLANAWLDGTRGLLWALFGCTLAAIFYLPPFFFGFMGAGDVKLMAAVGSIVGPQSWLRIFFWTVGWAAVLGLGTIVIQGRVRETLRNMKTLIGSLLRGRRPEASGARLDIHRPDAAVMPHAVAIAAATVSWMLWG